MTAVLYGGGGGGITIFSVHVCPYFLKKVSTIWTLDKHGQKWKRMSKHGQWTKRMVTSHPYITNICGLTKIQFIPYLGLM